MGGERETLWTDCRRWQAPLPLSLPVGAGVGPATRRRGLQQCARGSRDLQTLGRRWMGSELGGGGGGGHAGFDAARVQLSLLGKGGGRWRWGG